MITFNSTGANSERSQLKLEIARLKADNMRLHAELDNIKKDNNLLDPEYLKFNSSFESGNLDRVEAFPINHNMISSLRAAKETVIHEYNLFIKVDTNTKGH